MCLDSLRQALFGPCRMNAGSRVLAAVSGGMDSMFLLTRLLKLGIPAAAAVFDHQLRPESAEEQAFVRDFCRERGVPCFCGSGDVRAFAETNKLGLEEAARQLRYRFLMESAAVWGADAVATAHHANDRAETLLLHLLRGCGTDGLCGIRPYLCPNAFSQTIPLIRPLLDISRAEIETVICGEGIPYREDRSNFDTAYTRNRIRRQLLPELAADYNPEIVSALCRLAESAALDREILDRETAAARSRVGWEESAEGVCFQREPFSLEPVGLRLRLLRQAAAVFLTDAPALERLKDADAFFQTARLNQTVPWLAGVVLVCEAGRCELTRLPLIDRDKYPQLSDGWTLCREILTRTAEEPLSSWVERAKADPYQAYLDADTLTSDPLLRRAEPGERFQLCGSGGRSQKLSDFRVNCKIPRACREGQAVAADSSGILWIPGFRVAERCSLTESTRTILHLWLRHEQTYREISSQVG